MSAVNAPHKKAVSWTDLNLDDAGRIVIEASAGTGKTWTIGVIYLRLLLERGLSARQIVVSTFSEAAAQELHERIRLRLHWAVQTTEATESTDVETPLTDECYLRDRWLGNAALQRRDQLRLRLALSELDLAPIGTLHGWCTRILRDYPFAAGSGFEMGDLVSESDFFNELFDDLTRRLAQSTETLGDGDRYWLMHLRELRSAMMQIARGQLQLDVPTTPDIEAVFKNADLPALRDLHLDKENRFKRSNAAYRTRIGKLITFLEAGDPSADSPELNALIEQDWAGQFRPEHLKFCEQSPLLTFAKAAAETIGSYMVAERAQALKRYHAQWMRWIDLRLSERNQFSYDQLIERVYVALTGPDRKLADTLHQSWPVILIDEFQDTDARQYAIVDAIQRDAEGAVRGCTIMVGDPKQGIYGFRGGNIHVYQRAVAQAQQQLTLDTNHRSASRYVQALNDWYERVAPGMTRLDEDNGIDVPRVQASTRRADHPYTIDDEPVSQPLQVHFAETAPTPAAERERMALEACAGQIASLLQSQVHRIGATLVSPGDIAVLLPNHRHIATLRNLLGQRGVPCSGASRHSVFDTDWARDLQVIFYALHHLDDAFAVRAACSTQLLGQRPEAIVAMDQASADWQNLLQRLHGLERIWVRQGVLAVVQRLLSDATRRLQALGDFERHATDLRHLGELLQEASVSLSGPEQLRGWLKNQRHSSAGSGDESEEQQLRIESDGARVRLLTLHASKGLEFGIVFLPLMWAHHAKKSSGYPVTMNRSDGQRQVDLGTAQFAARKAIAANEDQEERFRVLYVALTRAIHACHVYALDPARPADGKSKSPRSDPSRAPWDALVERWLAVTTTDAGNHGSEHVHWHQTLPSTTANYSSDSSDHGLRQVQTLPTSRVPICLHSFSSLTRNIPADARDEAPAVDEQIGQNESGDEDDVVAKAHSTLVELHAVRGAPLGNALHAILELRDRGCSLSSQVKWAAQLMRQHQACRGLDESRDLAKRWTVRLDVALATDLGDGLRLDALPSQAQRTEMGFHFSVDQVRLERMRQACVQHGYPDLIPDPLSHARLNGMVTGKIDLVLQHQGRFHVLDYKGNSLGTQLENYRGASLQAAMQQHHYSFQALMYVLALDRYLDERIDDYQRKDHLGGAIYLWVRAVGLDDQAGIWRRRFPDALVADLQALLSGQST